MPGFVIGTQMNIGFLGQFARNGDYVVRGDRPVESTDAVGVTFGAAVFANSNGTVSSINQFVGGAILTVAIGSNAGTGYAVNDIVTIVQSGASGGQARVTSVSAGGVVTGLVLIEGGVSYTSASNKATTTAGAGTSLTITITAGNTPTMSNFAGIAVREVKTMETFFPTSGNAQPDIGSYLPTQPCDVLKRGCIIVQFQSAVSSTATAGGAVYLRIALNGTYPNAVVGGFESAADGGNTLALTNCQFFTGIIDGNSLVEVELLTIANA